MNPVMSDLTISVAHNEAERRHAAIQRDALARAAMQSGASSNPLAGIVAAIRHFLDPRGYALAEAAKRVAAPPVPAAPASARPTLIALATPEIAPGDRHQRQAA
jgi:hypothetical protein